MNKLGTTIISIIIVCFNDADKLEKTIKNVILQNYKNKELIIVDGGSQDNTLKIIKKYNNYVSYFISEEDRGIYDAMNKGIDRSNGDIIHFLNTGDYYYSTDVLTVVSDIMNSEKNIGILYGKAENYSKRENIKYISGEKININKLWKGMPICHQSMFFRRYIFNIIGNYDINYKSMADYELLIRFIKAERECSLYFVDKILSKFELNGYSNKDYLVNLSEMQNIVKKYYSFNYLKKCYFLCKRIKFYFLILLKKIKLHSLYRKIKYEIIKGPRVKSDRK